MKSLVGERRFELPTSCSRSKRANQTALLPGRYSVKYMSLVKKSSPSIYALRFLNDLEGSDLISSHSLQPCQIILKSINRYISIYVFIVSFFGAFW